MPDQATTTDYDPCQPTHPVKADLNGSEIVDKELTAQCEALDVPGYKVETDGVFTVVRRISTPDRSASFPARIARWLVSVRFWFPYLYRFTRESVQLSPWRMAILMAGKLITSLSPTLQLWLKSRMLIMVERAIKTGHIDRTRLAIYALCTAFFSTAVSTLSGFFARNAGVLERYFEAMIHTRLMETIARLDYTTASDPGTQRLLGEAARTIQSGSEQAFAIVTDVTKVFTSAIGVITQAVLLRQTVNRSNLDLIGIGFAANLIRSASWLFRGDPGVRTAPTNPLFQRMQSLWESAQDTSPQAILLQLPKYWHAEYVKADAALGPIWTYRLADKSRIARTTSLLAQISDPLVYTLFALRGAARRRSGSLASALYSENFSMGGLTYIQNASASIAEELARFFYTLDDVRQHCTKIMQYYSALETKSKLAQPEKPLPYAPFVKGDKRGMRIELKGVAYKYPGSEHYALKDVSCIFEPGTLTCVVGFNGAGKSTLINLLTRILDSTEGSVDINGQSAKAYSPDDLYRRISCEFQETEPSDVTIREWLQMADVSTPCTDARMWECIRLAGLEKVILRFPKGLDARLGPYPANPTPASFLKEVVKDHQTGPIEPWEADFDKLVKKEIEEEEEWVDEVVGGAGASGGSLKGKDCAFSPGEWQKLCFAASLIKQDADLRIFDEPSASLDPVASRQVFDRIDNLRGQSTVIHITHDLSACLKADQVIMFEEGKNIESGTHDELLARSDSQYRKFYLASLGQDEDEDSDSVGDEATEAEKASVADSEQTAVSEPDSSDERAWVDEEDAVEERDALDESLEEIKTLEGESMVLPLRATKGRERADSGFDQGDTVSQI